MTRCVAVLLRRRVDDMRSVTVSYKASGVNLVTSRVGYGKTFADALLDADKQLPDGMWDRLVCSNPATISEDLDTTRKGRFARSTLRSGEGKTIMVEKNVRVIDDATKVDE